MFVCVCVCLRVVASISSFHLNRLVEMREKVCVFVRKMDETAGSLFVPLSVFL